MNAVVPVIALDHLAAYDVARVGRRAAILARARAAGLPVAAGVVLTSEWETGDRATALQVWRITSHDGARPLVVRPSAIGQNVRPNPEAGVIEPAVVVHDGDAMLAAVDALRAADPGVPVLLQPHLPASWRGVLYADDAAAGWRSRPLVVASDGAEAGEWIAETDHAGRVQEVLSGESAGDPPTELLARLARLAQRVAAAFDDAHDLDWISDAAGRVLLLGLRPVIRLHAAAAQNPGRDRELAAALAA